MRLRVILLAVIGCLGLVVSAAIAQEPNFPDRKAILLNVCPHVELSSFSFHNFYEGRRFGQNMSWKNMATQPLVAFEIVILKYDAFDQRVIGSRWTVTGKNSADWRPLAPGASGSDSTTGLGIQEVFTAIAYVRAARLADGTVWRVNEAQLLSELRKVAPGIKEFGNVNPDPKP